MIKNVKIRILAFFMALTLLFCVCSHEYYEVKALEWVAPVVGVDTALKALLGLLGISAGVGLASQIDWSDLQDDCVQYQIQKGNDAVAVGRWWDKVISGGLDTASSCWDSFIDWAKTKISASSGEDYPPISVGMTYKEACDFVATYLGIPDYKISGTYKSNPVYAISINTYGVSGNPNYTVIMYLTNGIYTCDNGVVTCSVNGQNVTFNNANNIVLTDSKTISIPNGYSQANTVTLTVLENLAFYNFSNILNVGTYIDLGALVSGGESVLDSAVTDLGVIGLAPDVATDLPYDGVIDIPWENVGATDTAIDDAFDDALDKVNTGTWTLDQYWTWVQNVTNVFAYDTTNNFLLPNDGDDEKADDKVQQNINRGAMVLYGLEKVFPFCIPWDIYAFVNLLVADPVAPVIEYPIYNPVSGEDEIITIDFSVWESQVILMRYIQDFLLIIGLLLLARSLIGAGGSD